jgi:hypothetical protein
MIRSAVYLRSKSYLLQNLILIRCFALYQTVHVYLKAIICGGLYPEVAQVRVIHDRRNIPAIVCCRQLICVPVHKVEHLINYKHNRLRTTAHSLKSLERVGVLL